MGTLLVAAAALTLGACSDTGTTPVDDPNIPGDGGPSPSVKTAAFIFDVNKRTGKIKITAPTRTVNGVAPSFSGSFDGKPAFSVLGGDVIEVATSAFNASLTGDACAGGTPGQPGKVCVTFDVSLTNKLGSVRLIGPTVFPSPPAGTTGPLLFAFELVPTLTDGGTSTGGQGNDVIVELPSRGEVTSNAVWDGTEHNFFNDSGCGAGDNDCYRYEEYATIEPGETTTSEKVGFFVDPTLGSFRVRVLIAADLQNAGAAPTGTVDGNVTSPQIGDLQGVTVTVTSGGLTGSTDAGGDYAIANVTTGPKTVALSNLPASCTNPGSQGTTVTSGATSTVNFVVQCTAPSGSVSGTVTSSLGGGINNATVTVTPGGVDQTDGSGAYSVSGVPVGSGTVAVSNLPANCAAVADQPYNVASAGANAVVNFVATCTAPPPNTLTGTWTVTGSVTATLELRLDITSGNVGDVAFDFNRNSSRLTYIAYSNDGTANDPGPATTPALNNVFATDPAIAGAGIIQISGFTTIAAGATVNTGIIRLRFNIGSGAAVNVQSLIAGLQINNNAGTDVTSSFGINISQASLPAVP